VKQSIQVKLYSPFRDLVGESTVYVDVPQGGRIRDVVDALKQRYTGLANLLDAEDRQGHFMVLLNGSISSMGQEVNHNDQVALLSPMMGG